MLRGENYRTHSCLSGKCGYLISIKGNRIEFVCGRGVPVAEDASMGLNLLAVAACYRFPVPYSTISGIEAEVNEHGIFIRMPSVE